VNNFAVQKVPLKYGLSHRVCALIHPTQLFYDADVNATTAVLATFSTACFGYGLVGILRPLTVSVICLPSEWRFTYGLSRFVGLMQGLW
jgi:hypothetical protein